MLLAAVAQASTNGDFVAVLTETRDDSLALSADLAQDDSSKRVFGDYVRLAPSDRAILAMQEARVKLLFSQKKARRGLVVEKARQLMWMYTSRDVYRMLVVESGWSPE